MPRPDWKHLIWIMAVLLAIACFSGCASQTEIKANLLIDCNNAYDDYLDVYNSVLVDEYRQVLRENKRILTELDPRVKIYCRARKPDEKLLEKIRGMLDSLKRYY
jgi:thioredoxin-related protein